MVREFAASLNAVDCSSTMPSLSATLLGELLALKSPKAVMEKHPSHQGFKQHENSARTMKARMMQSLLKCVSNGSNPIDDEGFTATVESYMHTRRLADRTGAALEVRRAGLGECAGVESTWQAADLKVANR
jgi:hypothetical protein